MIPDVEVIAAFALFCTVAAVLAYVSGRPTLTTPIDRFLDVLLGVRDTGRDWTPGGRP